MKKIIITLFVTFTFTINSWASSTIRLITKNGVKQTLNVESMDMHDDYLEIFATEEGVTATYDNTFIIKQELAEAFGYSLEQIQGTLIIGLSRENLNVQLDMVRKSKEVRAVHLNAHYD